MPRRRDRPAAARPLAPATSPLRRTIDAALRRLVAARQHGVVLVDGEAGRIDRALRAALAEHTVRAGGHDAGVPALRVGCAHLLAGDLENAYSGLLSAREHIR